MASGWWAPVDAYCERVDAGFWSEPVNALTNGAFIIAAGLAYLRWRRAGAADRPALYLVLFVAAVGIGSFLFHTFANRWSRLADVLPIALFIYSYFFLTMRRYVGLSLPAAAAATLGFAALSFGFERAWVLVFGRRGLELMNFSVGYFPAALALLGVGAALIAFGGRVAARIAAGKALLLAAGVFIVSLVFRTVDQAICAAWPLGTHFAWHGLNAVVLFILVAAAIRFRAALRTTS
jgi:Ceramidase